MRASESCQHTGSITCHIISDNTFNTQLLCCLDSAKGHKLTNIAILGQGHINNTTQTEILLGLFSDSCHCPDCLHRIFATGSLTREHQRISMWIDGIGNIRYLCTRGTRIIYHGVKHLSRHNHRFLCHDTFTDDLTLNTRDTFDRYLDAQITTCDHDAVGSLNDSLETFISLNSLLGFNLCR